MHFSLHSFIDAATELHRNDIQIQREVSKARENIKKDLNHFEAVVKSMSKEMELVEQDLAKQKSREGQSSAKK